MGDLLSERIYLVEGNILSEYHLVGEKYTSLEVDVGNICEKMISGRMKGSHEVDVGNICEKMISGR